MPPLTEQQLADDLTRAMKTREMLRVYVLRAVLTAVKNLKVEKRGGSLGEEELIQLVRREIRKLEEAESFAAKAGRQELVEQNQTERAFLESYVPVPLDAAQLDLAIRELAARSDAPSLGAIMGGLRAQYAGRYDGRQASDIARRVLTDTRT